VGLTASPSRWLDGRQERLEYIAGDVPVPPFPEWWRTDRSLASTAVLLPRFHDATEGLEVGERSLWSQELADPRGGKVICHNDVCPENVVYRDGAAVALLDLDYAERSRGWRAGGSLSWAGRRWRGHTL
jgi:hypothetical protein